jgi:hypothetical protein
MARLDNQYWSKAPAETPIKPTTAATKLSIYRNRLLETIPRKVFARTERRSSPAA